ncbi:hypothetical protein HK103_005202 [Boothiomyces macroporosus]|uniref:non-specific serine/threonine protein kinase n=1 Tax=Boothiomyces macroporosus TaxID=261099 RepID=A0AAD5UFG5_9FUNG|nr:hypothetical protein HK103_005202 [Boothiomyces macroporosus]
MKSQQLQGNLTSDVTKLQHLTLLDLSDNQLNGQIPSNIGDMYNLQVLNLAINNLSGSIPDSIGKLVNLQQLVLSKNTFGAAIPSSIGNLQQLTNLEMFGNQFNNAIPTSIYSLSKLTNFNLAYNQLSGTIPPEIKGLVSATAITLDYNFLSGGLPTEVGSLTNLLNLYLDHNRLTGNVPVSITNIQGLVNLDMSHNNLTGTLDPLILGMKHSDNFNFNGNDYLIYPKTNTTSTSSSGGFQITPGVIVGILFILGALISFGYVAFRAYQSAKTKKQRLQNPNVVLVETEEYEMESEMESELQSVVSESDHSIASDHTARAQDRNINAYAPAVELPTETYETLARVTSVTRRTDNLSESLKRTNPNNIYFFGSGNGLHTFDKLVEHLFFRSAGTAVCEFQSRNASEIDINEGDFILVDEYFPRTVGTNTRTGKKGYFPPKVIIPDGPRLILIQTDTQLPTEKFLKYKSLLDRRLDCKTLTDYKQLDLESFKQKRVLTLRGKEKFIICGDDEMVQKIEKLLDELAISLLREIDVSIITNDADIRKF